MGREGISLTKRAEGWKRLWVVVSAIWVVVGIIISSVYFYDVLIERSYYSPWGGSVIFEVAAATLAVFLPPFLVEPIIKVLLWIVDGFKGKAGDDSEKNNKIESYSEMVEGERSIYADENYWYDGGFYTLNLISDFWASHPKVKKIILLIPLLTFVFYGIGIFSMSIEPIPEVFRPILVLLLVLPVFVIPVFGLSILVFLMHSVVKRELKFSSLLMGLVFSLATFSFGLVRIIHENLGYFDFGFIPYAFSEGIILNLSAEAFGVSGLFFAALHLAFCAAREKKRNSNSYVSVIVGWSVVGFIINGMYFIQI